jgi:hypothetical protein
VALQIAQELFSDGGRRRDGCRAANARKLYNDGMQKILFFSFYLTLRLAPTTSKVFKASYASSCVSAQERENLLIYSKIHHSPIWFRSS